MKNLLCMKFSLSRQKALTSGCVCWHPLLPLKMKWINEFLWYSSCMQLKYAKNKRKIKGAADKAVT